MRASIRTAAFAIAVFVVNCIANSALGHEEVCHDAKDGVRAKRRVVVPEGTQQAFIDYIRKNGAAGIYSTGEVEGDHHLGLFLNTAGVYISIHNSPPRRQFLLTIETCNAKEDWRPHWGYVINLVNGFLQSTQQRSSEAKASAQQSVQPDRREDAAPG